MEACTQMRFARAGETTDAMRRVAEREGLAPDLVRDEVARGRLIIPANVQHLAGRLDPMAIGAAARVKINANIGNSAVTSSIDEEVAKLELAIRYGAGTVPIYQAVLMGKELEELTAEDLLDVIEHQARQGVDYMTIHAGILLQHLPLVYGRVTGIVRR